MKGGNIMQLARIKKLLFLVLSFLFVTLLPAKGFSQTFNITIDATSLTAQYFGIQGITDQFSTENIQSLSFEAGTYRFFTGYINDTYFYFTINQQGLIEYDASLEPVLDGAGTSALVVNGAPISFDATALTADTFGIYRYPTVCLYKFRPL
jgi:hypothetical protein